MPQISLRNISKIYKVSERPQGRFGTLRGAFYRTAKEIKALDEISFDIEQGELIGYIGPNGAGKSTTVKVMSGILTPEHGECRINGYIPWKDRVAHVSRIGVVFGQRSQLWWDVPVSDSFELLRDIYGIPPAKYKERLNTLTKAIDVSDLLKTPVRQLSLGQRMRCEIVAALLHSPDILFLDEPTIGLDAVSKLALREFLKQENKQNGVTMILTTHDMDDIAALCDRVMVIGRGKLLFDGDLSSLKSQYSPLRLIRATMDGDIGSVTLQGAVKTEIAGNCCTIWFDPSNTAIHEIVASLPQAIVSQSGASMQINDIIIEEQDIDEIIALMYKELSL